MPNICCCRGSPTSRHSTPPTRCAGEQRVGQVFVGETRCPKTQQRQEHGNSHTLSWFVCREWHFDVLGRMSVTRVRLVSRRERCWRDCAVRPRCAALRGAAACGES